jgi:AraC-like DNA-binding protein
MESKLRESRGSTAGETSKVARSKLRFPTTEIHIGKGCEGIERVEVSIRQDGFSLHQHDTYAIGLTLCGVQTFTYRGGRRYCLPGRCHILHPDERHDGYSLGPVGFRYRIAYIDPSLIQRAFGGGTLPFVEDPIVNLTEAQHRNLSILWEIDAPLDGFAQTDVIAAVAALLETLSPRQPRRRTMLRVDKLHRVREFLAADPHALHPVEELERVADLDRWTLARQFRAAFGTSPTRFRTMRQLDQVRRTVKCGASLAEASAEAGFYDQSHMTRMFKLAYGLSPGSWAASLSTRPHQEGLSALPGASI